MALFEYSGRDTKGNLISGSMETSSLETAMADLRGRGIMPSKIVQGKSGSGIAWFDNLNKQFQDMQLPKITDDDLIMFCRQMHALMKSGIPLLRAIEGLGDSTRNERLKRMLGGVSSQLQAGSDLATSMAQQKEFDSLFISMIRMGEATGRLDQAFHQLVMHLEQEKDTKKRVVATVRYPSFVIGAIAVALLIINLKVIPAFSTVFKQFGADLPWPTKLLIGTSNFTLAYGWYLLAIAIAAFYGVRRYISTEKGRWRWDRLKLKLPLVGGIFERITISRFTRPFAMMLDAGVPLIQALGVTGRTVGNAYVGGKISSMTQGIERGDSLLNTAANTQMFTPLVLQMIAVGEETGNVSELLNDISDFYDQEVDYDLKKLAENIEPILLAIMGALVLILALGVFLPMWDLSSAARG
jgi:MSHA biogenesis protein MshG